MKMKKIMTTTAMRLLAASVIISFVSSCNLLDLRPENALTQTNAFVTETELNATTVSILFLTSQAMADPSVFQTAGEVVDETYDKDQQRQWNPKTIIGLQQSWKGFYDVIYESNLLLDNIHQTSNLSEQQLAYHRGQALFAKGFAYLNVAMRFGDAVVTTDSKVSQPYGISPVLKVLDEAIQAGTEAYEILPAFEDLKLPDASSPLNKQYASKGAAAALLAHAYAWKGSVIELYNLQGDAKEAYQASIRYATSVIDGKAGSYSLLSSPQELVDYLSNADQISPEDIYVLAFDKMRSEYSSSPSVARFFVSWPIDETKKPEDIIYGTDLRLYRTTALDLFPDEGDQRRESFFYKLDEDHMVNDISYAIMNKYNNALYNVDEFSELGKVYRTLNAHYTYWRLADIILLRAECQAKLGNDGEAIQDLNTIRNRAGAALYPAAQDTKGVKYAVFKERERELLFESDHRYFDVVRNNYMSTEFVGKLRVLTPEEIKGGALVLPVSSGAYGEGHRNTLIRQKDYWIQYEN